MRLEATDIAGQAKFLIFALPEFKRRESRIKLKRTNMIQLAGEEFRINGRSFNMGGFEY